MKALLQRVASARVDVAGETVSRIGRGLLVLLGVERGDDASVAERTALKAAALRIFDDDAGDLNLSLEQVGGEALVVSQFTLAADTRKGRRPSFLRAAPPEEANPLYLRFVEVLRSRGIRTETGRFQTVMQVHLVNDGPVTIWLEG